MSRVNPQRRRGQYWEDEAAEPYHPSWPFFSFGYGDQKDFFVENLSLLVGSGMGITQALATIGEDEETKRMSRAVKEIERLVDGGSPLWKALAESRLLPPRIIALIRSGEQSGRLPEHLNLAVLQQQKERIFSSRIRSALLYPSIILIVAFLVGIGSAWYTLPRLISVFTESQAALPLATRILVHAGEFIKTSGVIALPLIFIGFGLIIYFLFIYRKTKFIGEGLLMHIPGLRRLIQGVEIARFGFVFGALLGAGLQITDSIESLREGTSFRAYEKFYIFLRENVEQGNSLEKSFKAYPRSRRLIPLPMQQMIAAGERSGKLPETLVRIGQIFEEKTETMTKDLSVVLEPIVLVVVGSIVGLVALAILSPIYSLVQQIS